MYNAKIKLHTLHHQHSPSEKEGLDEMIEILIKYVTKKTIDPKHTLESKNFILDKWMGMNKEAF